MVHELRSSLEAKNHINEKRLAGLAIANRENANLWGYVKRLLSRIEDMSSPAISFAMVHYGEVLDMLEPSEIEIARKSVIIKLYLDGTCIFEQEGVLGSRINDETVLKRGIRETLKHRLVEIRFSPV
uniref:Uncharacterized protein n=1 Tax=Ignisphaera aggregans TaxID=334771 RepID=A0A7C2Z8R6_9CREN